MHDIARFSIVGVVITSVLFLSNLNNDRNPQPDPEAVELTLFERKQSREAERLAAQAKEEYCLAKNIYHEAGVESEKGKIAVGQVTLNRVSTGRWGDTVCDVVYAYKQFSWTLEPRKVEEQPSGPLWEASLAAAHKVFAGKRVKAVGSSLFYHTDYIKTPKWADRNALMAQVGQHLFYTKAKLAQDSTTDKKTKRSRSLVRA
jgi:spore germination cell wall hydrolase CwlJ-like protein